MFVHAVLRFSPGYGSKYDGEEHESHACEQCYERLMNMMKIPPSKIRDDDAAYKNLVRAYEELA